MFILIFLVPFSSKIPNQGIDAPHHPFIKHAASVARNCPLCNHLHRFAQTSKL